MDGFTLGTIGNAPIGDCLGPPTRVVDFSVSKNFNITERVKAQFRMDFFNLFNHPNYGSLGDTQGLVPIGFNAVNTAGSPEFLDASGAATTNLANADRQAVRRVAVAGQHTNRPLRKVQYSPGLRSVSRGVKSKSPAGTNPGLFFSSLSLNSGDVLHACQSDRTASGFASTKKVVYV
jgi:hypothetical protein